jgi:outer membrane protein TolC
MGLALKRGGAPLLGILLACACFSAGARAALAAPATAEAAGRAVVALPDIPQHGVLVLTPRLLLQLTLARNADALYAQLASAVAGHLADAEKGLFEVVAYGGVRHEDRKRKRTAQELDLNSLLNSQSVLDEQVGLAEMGVKRRMSFGGELSLSYRLTQRQNNLIKASPISKGKDTEYDGALALTFKQPLLRGFGGAAVEADRKIAELEWAISKQQYKQQMLRSSSEALAAYWQLYRAHQALDIRREALRKAEAARHDIETRIAGGRLPPRMAFEARSAVSTRKAEALRAEQGLNEAESKIKSLLNLTGTDYAELSFMPGLAARPALLTNTDAADARLLEQALQHWPSYRIANLKRQQGQIRLDFAGNQKRPQLDLMASCSSTSLSYSRSDAQDDPFKRDYPDCYIGLNMEIPLRGNLRATSQFQAQRVRMSQSDIEIEAVRGSLANDLSLRTRQLERAGQEVAEYRKDVDLRTQLLEMEQKQFELGMSRLSQVIGRENELNASRESLLDSQARLELAQIALQVADGSLFGEYAVEWRGD